MLEKCYSIQRHALLLCAPMFMATVWGRPTVRDPQTFDHMVYNIAYF